MPGLVSLGSDTSFCEGESIVLEAGQGFDNYLWSTGDASQKISVDKAGAFSVTATSNGCMEFAWSMGFTCAGMFYLY